MVDVKFNNRQLKSDVKSILDNGYTVKAGTISGNSIEIVETCISYTYYDRVNDRDEDLESIKKLITDEKV